MYYSDWSLLGFWVKSHIDLIFVEFEQNSYLRLCSKEVMLAPSIQTAPDRSRADALNFFLCSVRDKTELFASFSRAIFVKIRPGYNYSSGCVYIRKKTRQNTMT